MRRSFVFLIIIAALVFPVGVFAGQAGTDADRTGLQNELQPVTLMLDWVPNVNHVGLYVARDGGFFKDAGLDVRIIEPGEVYATTAVVGGQADFGIDFQENITLLRSADVPVVSIAAVLQTNTSGFAVRASDGIESPRDFEGLVYGTFNSPFEQPTLSTLVQCAGGDPAGIEYVTAGTDLLAMLDRGLADIIWIFYGTQGFQADRIGLDIDYFPLNQYTDCIPDYYSPVIIASEETISTRPDLVRSFLDALSRAHEFVVASPHEAAAMLAEAVPELDPGELDRSVPWLSQYMLLGGPWGRQELSVWEEYGRWMEAAGVLEGEFDPASAFTSEFLPK